MNTKNLKAYAPKARSQFIDAIKKRAAQFGIYQDRIEPVQIEGGAAIIEGRAFTRQEGEQRKRLEKKVTERASATYPEKYDMFIREMAYTWFNRFAAIRYMELHGYFDHGFRVLSHPSSVDSLPEILSHASDVADGLKLDKSHIIELQLAGDKEEELYRELLLGQCHQLANIMPFVFSENGRQGLTADSINDAAELLLPDNLTKTDSILKGLINDIPEEDWNDIEVIGWLYQFYISEHKDAVIGKVVKSEDIPAATQLFTPNWIVKYLVQNSVGRQWLATYPDSELKGKMEYYIEPAEQSDDVIEQLKSITPTSINPEEIKVLDPAAGSGHILVEVYEVLREIYLERGYRLREIPELILTKNIYGLDIDDRAAQLAGFALMMKAREDDRRIFQRVEDGEVSLNVFSLQSTEHLDILKIWKALDLEGNQQTGSTGGLFETSDGFVQPTGVYKEYYELLQTLKSAFLQAKTLGSLIKIDNQHLDNLISLKALLIEKLQGTDPAAKKTAVEFTPIINQAIALSQEYEAVVANPPYMGLKFQNRELKEGLKSDYTEFSKDVFSAFMVRCNDFCVDGGFTAFVTPYVWMFIISYEKLREYFYKNSPITTLVQLEYNSFSPACIPVCAFVTNKGNSQRFNGQYINLSEFKGSELQPIKTLEAINDKNSSHKYTFAIKKLNHIPGKPLIYWAPNQLIESFIDEENFKKVGLDSTLRKGMSTGDNPQFVRMWSEIDFLKSNIQKANDESGLKWFAYNNGGDFRKWYGNIDRVVDWESDGYNIRNLFDDKGNLRSVARGVDQKFQKMLSWTSLSSTNFGVRYYEDKYLSDQNGNFIIDSENKLFALLAYLCTPVARYIVKTLNPTMHILVSNVAELPFPTNKETLSKAGEIGKQCVEIAKEDWELSEKSWSFKKDPIVNNSQNVKLIQEALDSFIDRCTRNTNKLKALEEENNKQFIDLYGLTDVLDNEVQLENITLRANPINQYGLSEDKPIERFRSESVTNLLSYFVGNAMGRYSQDKVGLVYAHSSNEGFKELVAEGAYKSFPADDDGITPLASEEWLFDDDATTRFKEFVKTVWGEEHLSENLEFVAESLCLHALKPVKGENANDTVRRYFSKQFYKDHCKTYKKRPIYWLFSSGKEKAFECLVYLHRYNESTLSRMRTEYVTPLMGKFDAQHTLLSEQQVQATGTEARRIEKELKILDKKQAELRTFDEQLKHYAEKRITLDLDDGVKANYGKFGNLLADVKAIHGKAVK